MQKPQFGLNQKATLMAILYGRLARRLAGLAFLIKRPRHQRIPGDFIDA
jgi:hypothetical protein